MLLLELSAILLTCSNTIGLEKHFLVFLRLSDLHRFYCSFEKHHSRLHAYLNIILLKSSLLKNIDFFIEPDKIVRNIRSLITFTVLANAYKTVNTMGIWKVLSMVNIS